MPKRKCVTEESSGGQHSAGEKPPILKATTKAKCSGGSHSAAPTSTLASSGSRHSAGKQAALTPNVNVKSRDFSLVLVDEDKFESGIDRKALIYDPRPELELIELDDILSEKCADLVIQVDSAGFEGTTWNFTCANYCEVTDEETFQLYGRFWATYIKLRRLTLCMDSMPIKIMLMKTLKGKANSDWFFGQNDREQLAYAIFESLFAEETLTYVIGNIGFGLSSFNVYCREYGAKIGKDVWSELNFLTNRDHTLSCIHKKDAENHFQSLVDMNQHLPRRIFELLLQAVQDPQDVRNSSGSHPAVGSQDDLDIDSPVHSFMKLLSEAEDMNDFAKAMFHPVVSRKSSNYDGPMDVQETMRLIQDGLLLAQQARGSAGVTDSDKELTESEEDTAFSL